jgi:hypothetical protein
MPDDDRFSRYLMPAWKRVLHSLLGRDTTMTWQLERLASALADRVPWHGLVSEFPAVLHTSPLAPAEVVRLYRAYVREREAVGPEFGLRRHDGAAAL